MITHGKKQISEIVYARKSSEGGGAVRLTNIIRGAQVVFGGLYPDVKMWLTGATNTAILAAFGQTDGKAVIKATNAYLNGIAATDPTKAYALAGFINEDPMLVCSLVETGKVREMYSDDNAYIELNLQINSITSDSTIGYRLRNASYTGNKTAMYGAKVNYNNNDLSISLGAWDNNGQAYIGYGMSYSNSWSYTKDTKPHTIRLANNTAYFDGEIKKSYSPNNFTTNPLLLYRVSGGGGDVKGIDTNTAIFFASIKDIEINIEMYPFIRNGENGMLDIISGTFYPNANTSGSFIIAYTLPDGTPWTPLNQQ